MYDLAIRNGTVIDGSGRPPVRADVGIVGSRIVAVGEAAGRARCVIDAEGKLVTPGFIDGHTHLDAQVFWDPLATSSCWHGVTTAVMGNCGFTLAPARPDESDLVLSNLERSEDIPRETLELGVEWSWGSFPEYLAAVDRRPKGINFAANVGHSALRTWAMGERAFKESVSAEDLTVMADALESALEAGAFGLTTTLNEFHQRADERPVASRFASWTEVTHLVGVLAQSRHGIFQITGPRFQGASSLADSTTTPLPFSDKPSYDAALYDLAARTNVPVAFGVLGTAEGIATLDVLGRAADAGVPMFGLTHPRGISQVLSFETKMPFDRLGEWTSFRRQPLSEQSQQLRDPWIRTELLAAARNGDYGSTIAGQDPRPPNYSTMYPLLDPLPPHRTLAELACERRQHPADVAIDMALEHDLRLFFVAPSTRYTPADLETVMKHPRTVMTFSDAGAHVSQMADASIHSYFLAHWVRSVQAFSWTEAIRMITSVPAQLWGIHDRGMLREGLKADINVIDADTVTPELPVVAYDLPGGAKRIVQRARGFDATIVNGQTLLDKGEHTGVLPGRLLRSRPCRP